MSSVDTTIWPDSDATPTGYVNTSSECGPFGVLRLLGDSAAVIQFRTNVNAAEQARYLRALAEVATRLADQLDPQDGAKP